MHRPHHPLVRALSIGALLCALASCGSSASSAATTAPAAAPADTTVAAPTTVAGDSPSTTAAAGGGSGKCGTSGAVAAATLAGSADVTAIDIIGGCMVSVSTKLQPGADGAKAALALCDQLAAVVYAAGAKSVSIDSAVGHELAAGLDGVQCIGEP